jgi:carboxymethylenebutenolidase
MTESREERIRAHDGHSMGGWMAVPESGSGPGLVVLQEIFGLTDYIKGVCDRLASLGYVALAPELYSRLEPDLVLDEHVADNLPRAFAAMQRLDVPQAVDDAAAALEHLRVAPEVRGGEVGVVGFCLGGGIAYMLAAASDPAVAVCYYGSAIPGALDRARQVTCPILFHFGEDDNYISVDQRRAVARTFAGRRHVELHVHPAAGHAFDNHDSALFHRPQAAARAWEQTSAFLQYHLPIHG